MVELSGKFVARSKQDNIGEFLSEEEFDREWRNNRIDSESYTEWYPDEDGIARPCRRVRYYRK